MSDESLQALKRARDEAPDDFVAFRRWRRAHLRAGGEGPELVAEATRLAIRWFVLSVRYQRVRRLIGERLHPNSERALRVQTIVSDTRDRVLRAFWRCWRWAKGYAPPFESLDRRCAEMLAARGPDHQPPLDSFAFVRSTDGAWAIISALKAAPPYIAGMASWRRSAIRTAEADARVCRFCHGTLLTQDGRARCPACTVSYDREPGGLLTPARDDVFDERGRMRDQREGPQEPQPGGIASRPCSACGGQGIGDYPFPCDSCGGSGFAR